MTKKNNKSFSVLIPDGESWLAYSVVNCLGRVPGVKISVLSRNACDPIRFSRYTSQYYYYPQQVNEDKLEAIKDIVTKQPIDIILPVDEDAIRLLSDHSEFCRSLTALALTPEVQAFDLVSNKWAFANWLQINHIPEPATVLYQAGRSFEEVVNAMTFPVLLKPALQTETVGFGGRGIHLFQQKEALLAFCEQEELSKATIPYILQPFIKGHDIVAYVLCRQGKIEAYTLQKSFLIDDNLSFSPSDGFDYIDHEEALAVLSDVVAKINWTGVANFDLRYDEQEKQIKVIEINPRFGGSNVGAFYAGVNFAYLTCLAGLGLEIPEVSYQKNMRYVTGRLAVSMYWQRLLGKREHSQSHFDHSGLELILQDPLPKLAAVIRNCRKLISRLKN